MGNDVPANTIGTPPNWLIRRCCSTAGLCSGKLHSRTHTHTHTHTRAHTHARARAPACMHTIAKNIHCAASHFVQRWEINTPRIQGYRERLQTATRGGLWQVVWCYERRSNGVVMCTSCCAYPVTSWGPRPQTYDHSYLVCHATPGHRYPASGAYLGERACRTGRGRVECIMH